MLNKLSFDTYSYHTIWSHKLNFDRHLWGYARFFGRFSYQPILRFNFVYLGFLSLNIHFSEEIREKGRSFLTPPYHFKPPHKHLNLSWVITTVDELTYAHGSLNIGSNWKKVCISSKLVEQNPQKGSANRFQ